MGGGEVTLQAGPVEGDARGEGDVHDVRPVIAVRGSDRHARDLGAVADDALGGEKTEREFRIVARRAQGDDQRAAVHADLEGALDRDRIILGAR